MSDFVFEIVDALPSTPAGQGVGDDHVAEALDRLCEQFRGKPKIAALLTGLASPMQDIEAALRQLLLERGVYTAAGAQLDVIGRIVGQARLGMADGDYRRFLLARITANRSNGTSEDLLRVARLVINDATVNVRIVTQGPAALVVRVNEDALSDDVATILMRFLRASATGGVRVLLESSTEPPGDVLRFDVGPGFDVGHLATVRE